MPNIGTVLGMMHYPRHALVPFGNRTLYLDGSQSHWSRRRLKQLFDWASTPGRKLLITEGQSEPWETVTVPTNPASQGLASCLPEHLVANYNACMGWFGQKAPLYAYLFWGAEYWLLRKKGGDLSYLRAFERVLEKAGG